MPADLQALLKPALMNNSFDYENMESSLKKAYFNSYHYLYNRQVAEVNYNEFFYYTNDIDSRKRHESGRFYLNKSLKAVFEIDYDIIGNTNREEFRRSRFYQTEFTFMDMVYNPQIFSQIPIVIIDNRVIYDYHISVSEDYTRFRLPFGRSFVLKNPRNPITDKVIYIDHRVQVITIDNNYYQRFLYNKGSLLFDDVRKTVTFGKTRIVTDTTNQLTNDTNNYYLKKYKVNELSGLTETQRGVLDRELKKRLGNLSFPDTSEGIIFISLHFLNENNKEYELGTSLLELEDNGDGTFTCKLPNNLSTKLKYHNHNVYVSFIFFRGLHKHIFNTSDILTSRNNMFDMMVIEDRDGKPTKSPIPVENMMIFKKTSNRDEFYLDRNIESCEIINTNIYKIGQESDLIDTTDKMRGVKNNISYKVYYFYYNIPNLSYRYQIKPFMDYLKTSLKNMNIGEVLASLYYNKFRISRYNDDQLRRLKTLFDNNIGGLQPYDIKYGDIDYNDKIAPDQTGKGDYPPFKYKDKTLRKWIEADNWILRDYVLDQNKLNSSYFLFTNTIDLSTRIRRDTSTELGSGSLFQFDEDRYVFAFNNSREYPVSLDARIFVDGLLVGDVYQERKNFLEYFYIPKSMVTDDSFIEIELFPRYKYKKDIKFTNSTDTKDIILPPSNEVVFPTPKDIIISEDTPDGEIRYDSESLDIICHFKRGDFEYEPMSDADVGTPVPPNHDIPYRFTRLSSFTIKSTDSTLINKDLTINLMKSPTMIRFVNDVSGYRYIEIASRDFQLNTEYIRIFKNGRLLSQDRYRLITSYGNPKILIQQWLEIGDIVYVDITPYRYRKILRINQLNTNDDNIMISLANTSIDKPFDVRYYDVYLNGRKLSINNVFNLSEYVITLANIKSKYDLIIYEKERDYEYFGSTRRASYSLWEDLYANGLINQDEMKKLITNSINEQKDPRLTIRPNTFDEDRFDFGDVDLYYVIYSLFYYDALLPKTYYNPDVKEMSVRVMQDNFIEVYNRFKTTSVLHSNTDAERARRAGYPPVLYLDPDDFVDSSEGPKRESPDGPILTWVIGHSETEDVTTDMLNTTITIPKDSDLL